MTEGRTALVADDHELFSWALQSLLASQLGFETVHLAATREEAAEKLAADRSIELVCLDLTMPGMDGVASVESLKACGSPNLLVVLVTASTRRDDVADAIRAGVHGFVPKSLRTPEIAKAIRAVLDGQIFVPPPQALSRAAGAPARRIEPPPAGSPARRADDAAPRPELSRQQRNVGDLIVRGKTNKEIAYALNVAEGTVKVHVASLFRALAVHNRAEAVAMLLRMRETP